MRKAFPVFLIALACNFSCCVLLVHADPVRKPEVIGRNDGYEYQTETSERFDDVADVSRRSPEDRGRSNQPVGKWRNNGEALEPKWRDGDSIPLLPFSHYRSYARDEDTDDVEQEDLYETNQRPYKYRYTNNQRDQLKDKRVQSLNNYGTNYRNRENNDDDDDDDGSLDGDYSPKNLRPLKNSNIAYIRAVPHYHDRINGNLENGEYRKGNRNVLGESLNRDTITATRYRGEVLQARPNEYYHELNDEEYLRPRPRKRRPPSYEMSPVNEESPSREDVELKDPTRSLSQLMKETEDLSDTQTSNNERTKHESHNLENALELKMLLKMQQKEGSSLSEILQRRNLTLNDLLKGKADVINALRSKMTDESDEYVEEMSRVMSNSLMKLSATGASLPWNRSTEAITTTSEATTMKIIATSSTPYDKLLSRTTVTTDADVTRHYDEVSFNYTKLYVQEATTDTENMKPVHDDDIMKVTTPLSISTMITTSTSLPGTINFMEYILNGESNVRSTSNHGTKLENVEDDEIMEFSDFTDLKKGKSPMSPVRLTNEKTVRQSASKVDEEIRHIESTISIEQMLINPTERGIKLTKDCNDQDYIVDDDDNNNNNNKYNNSDREINQDTIQPTSNHESFAEDYNTFMETEYQNDSPSIDINEDNQEQSTSKSSTNHNLIEKERQNSTSPVYDKNHSTEYHQVNQSEHNIEVNNHTLKNHRRINNRRYEEAVSELEPEARAEIFELFASGSAGKRLERLLKSRNMSIEELIALRQRGSSKVHLTEVSRLKVPQLKDRQYTVTSETDNMDDQGVIIPLLSMDTFNEHLTTKNAETTQELEESMIPFKQDIISYLQDSFFDRNIENVSMSRLLDLVERDRNASKLMTFSGNDTQHSEKTNKLENSHQGLQIVDLLAMFNTLPFAQEVQRQFETGDHGQRVEVNFQVDGVNNANMESIDGKEKTIRSNNSSGEFHTEYIEETVRDKPNTIDIRRFYDETISSTYDNSAGEEKKAFSNVRPSIIASCAILGLTIVVFLAIFIVCRIRQKQRYMYRNSFSRAVFQAPVLAARKLSNSSSLSTVMVNVVATSTAKRPEKTESPQETVEELDNKIDIDNDSLDANDSWETIPDYAK